MPTDHKTVQVRSTSQRGRSLHTSASFTAGQTILTVDPLLILPTISHLESICAHCLRAGEPRACTRCRAAYYCNADCQRAAWRAVHGKECAALKKVAAERKGKGEDEDGQLPTPVRLLMQVLLLENKGVLETVAGLQGHTPEEGSKERRDVEMMAVGACVYAGKGNDDEVVFKAADLLYKVRGPSPVESHGAKSVSSGIDTDQRFQLCR
jgi:MYND finger